MSSIDSLLVIANAYATAAQVDLSTVSWRALGDTKKLAALVAGADIQTKRFEKTMHWFSENWPVGTDWPSKIARPQPASETSQVTT